MPAPEAEIEALRRVLHDYLEREAPIADALTDGERTARFVRAFQPGGLLVAEELGGAGGSVSDAVAVAAESGGALLDGSVLAAILVAHTLGGLPAAGERDALLCDLAAGTVRMAAPMWLTSDRHHGPADPPESTVLFVPDATHALIFDGFAGRVPAPALLLVALAGPGVEHERLGGIDPTRPLSRLRLAPGIGSVLATGDDARRLRQRYVTVARLMVASEQGAGARRCVQMSVDYAKVRTQFGVPIASFQAVKHTCATMQVDCVEAQALVDTAAAALGRDAGTAGALTGQAKALMSESFTAVARSAIEIHGGVGFAWEHPAQLFYKRALATAAYLGPADEVYCELFDAARSAC